MTFMIRLLFITFVDVELVFDFDVIFSAADVCLVYKKSKTMYRTYRIGNNNRHKIFTVSAVTFAKLIVK